MYTINFETFLIWVDENKYTRDCRGLWYSSINSDNDGSKFNFEDLIDHYLNSPDALKSFENSVTEEDKEHWRIMGKSLGYPNCCIEDFCNRKLSDRTKDQINISDSTGFIPCLNHTKLIFEGKTTLNNLINNRDPNYKPFPDV